MQTLFSRWYVIGLAEGSHVVQAEAVGPVPLPIGFPPSGEVTRASIREWLKNEWNVEPAKADREATLYWGRVVEVLRFAAGPINTLDDLEDVELRRCWAARYGAGGLSGWVLGRTEEEATAACRLAYGELHGDVGQDGAE